MQGVALRKHHWPNTKDGRVTLIDPDQHLVVMTALFVIAALGLLAERTRVGAFLTGAVFSILVAILAANLKIIPHSAPAYGVVFTYLVPVLIPLFLFQADLRRMIFETGRTTVAFLIATVGTVAGVTVAVLSLDLSGLASASTVPVEQREGAIAALFASTYIGGSANYAALGEITGLSSDRSFFSAATAADNLFSVIYLGVLVLLPGWRWLASKYPTLDHSEAMGDSEEHPISATSLALGLATALLVVAISDGIVSLFNIPGWRYLIISALTLSLATAIPSLPRLLAGSFEIGVVLAFVFFTAIAAGADVMAMISVAPQLSVMVLMLLLIHLVVTFSVGSLLRLSMPELIVASNAAVLGATTAPALAATRGWHGLVTPGVLAGVLGYAMGTFIGTLLFKFWPF